DNLGLAAACSSFCNEVQSRTSLQFECRILSLTRRLPSAVELHLFRIVQEAINNITKHARAKSVKLRIRSQKNSVVLKIEDDGQGFDPKAPREGKKMRHGLGLTNIRERALSMNGICEITSLPGRGTTISVRVPLASPKAGAKKNLNLKRKTVEGAKSSLPP
ncbi:MAG TPA: ATP-binding protein, partial [Phycisphaerae bacterium]|nr:ATP-binding protein [Phycisphaerae bacterium]